MTSRTAAATFSLTTTAARRTAFISERADAETDATPACEPLPIASRVAAWTVAAASGSETAARAPSVASSADHRAGGRGHPAADQPVSQQIAGSREPSADGTDRPAQPCGRLGVGQALEIAEDDRRPVLLRQPADFLVQRRQQLDPVGLRFRGDRFASERYGPHPGALGARLGLGGDSSGHAIQPAAQRVSHPDRSSPAYQHEERRLKGVLNVVRVGQARRQTPRTIGPCRATRTANAASAASAASSAAALRDRNRSSNSASDNPPATPAPKSVRT